MLYLQLFLTFLKIGAFTLGGGYAMIVLIQREVVDRRHWIEEEDFMDMIAIAQSAPGVIAVNAAIFIGWKIGGWKGLVLALLGAVLPSFIIILLIATVFSEFKDNPTIEAIFKGIRPAVVALIAAPLVKMAKASKISWSTAIIPVITALLIWLGGLSPVWIILATIICVLAVMWLQERRKQ